MEAVAAAAAVEAEAEAAAEAVEAEAVASSPCSPPCSAAPCLCLACHAAASRSITPHALALFSRSFAA